MYRGGALFSLALLAAASSASHETTLGLRIAGVRPGAGTVYAAVFDGEEAYREKVPFRTLSLQPSAPVLDAAVSLPPGEYVVSLYQDLNGNGRLDTNFLGIPREPFGISGYAGLGPPGGFDRLKFRVPPSGFTLEMRLITLIP